MPVPRGGGIRLVDALVRIVEERGGAFETGADVESVTVVGRSGRRGHRRRRRGPTRRRRPWSRTSLPTQLYGRLLARAELPELVRQAPRRFRYGRAEMQIHYALSELPRWEGDERLGRTAIVHVTPGLDGVSRAVNEADRGLLPAEGTIACGQPVAVDPSRAPDGSWILWLQLQELPSRPKGDAAGELDTGDGVWTEKLREALRRPHPGAARPPHPEPRVGDAEAGRPLAGGHRGGERQHGRRRHLRGLLRARPEPRAAPATRPSGPPHARRAPLPHRREHPPRPGPRRRLRARSRRRTSCARASRVASATSFRSEQRALRSSYEDPYQREEGRWPDS